MPDFLNLLLTDTGTQPFIPLEPVSVEDLSKLSGIEKSWVETSAFKASAGSICLLPDTEGHIRRVLVGIGEQPPLETDIWWLAEAAEQLPAGTYQLAGALSPTALKAASLGWCLAHYSFDRFLKDPEEIPHRTLLLPESVDCRAILFEAENIALVRDLINTPTESLGPSELQDVVEATAEEFGARVRTIVGDDLLDENFPAIHAVGRAAAEGREPRLIDLTWGDDSHPAITLVGKGVCYDTGGLDIKPGSGMMLMKKDMGGSAHALGLARSIMAAGLPIQLRLLIPAVENAISGNSYRPGDIIPTRKGFSVEVGNTDAEGRIVLCDALALASEGTPDMIIDFATLTGAARVALGPDLPATFTNDDTFWSALERAAAKADDPLWRMPLWAPYDRKLSSPIADMSNVSSGGFAGCITAALYLQRFVEKPIKWAHFDVYAWEPDGKPGRPKGAAVQAIRATYLALCDVFGLDA